MVSRRKAATAAAASLLMLASGAGWALANTAPPDGNGPTDQWRVPSNALTVTQNTTTQNVEQVLNTWAQDYDASDATAVAKLFTASGSVKLFSTDTTTTPWSKKPTGYSPSATPTGGTANGGCVATGRSTIVRFLEGSGLTSPHAWPDTAAGHTLLIDTLIKPGANANHATSHSYVAPGATWKGGVGTEQMFASFTRVNGTWHISEMDLLYNTPQPTYPCEN